MKKNFLQDVVPASQKRSIRDIPLPAHKEPRIKRVVKQRIHQEEFDQQEEVEEVKTSYVEEPVRVQEEDEDEYVPQRQPKSKKKRSGFGKKITYGVLAGIAICLLFFVSKTNATITITPKKVNQEVSVLIPLADSKLATKTQITKTVTKTLPATSEQQVEKQASGKIKIINSHKETPQELVKNTRFQTPNGLIYRIRDSIVVPGYTMNGSSIVPGTLEVEVFADSAGEEYNTSNAKFTIPGFSGKEQFEKIVAESVGNISGGYIGIQKVVSDEAKEQAEKELQEELKKQVEDTKNQSTEYVLVPNMETLSFGEIQDKPEGNSVVLSLSASVEAYSFVKKELSDFIGQNSVSEASTTDSFDVDMQNLIFSIEESAIKIVGNTQIIWNTDTEKLKEDFANKKRSEISVVIDSYKSLEKANAKLSPFWKSKFPSDTKKIEVIVSE